MIEIFEPPHYPVVESSVMYAAEQRYPEGHFVAFHNFIEECGHSNDFDELMQDLLSRGYTPENSVIVQVGNHTPPESISFPVFRSE